MTDEEGHWIDDSLMVVNAKPDFSDMGLEPIKTGNTKPKAGSIGWVNP